MASNKRLDLEARNRHISWVVNPLFRTCKAWRSIQVY